MMRFISNNCGKRYCLEPDCDGCPYYKPKFLGIRVPQKLGTWLFNLGLKLFHSKYYVEEKIDTVD